MRPCHNRITMTGASVGPLVSTAWLADQIGDPDLRILDATWYLPHLRRNAHAEFREAHIPGAVYFDIDAIADHHRGLPHMLPDPAIFAAAVGALGVGDGDQVWCTPGNTWSPRRGCGGPFAPSGTAGSPS